MKKLLISLLFLTACGDKNVTTNAMKDPNCKVTPLSASNDYPAGGALIECPDSKAIVTNGANGSNTFDIAEIVDPCGTTPGFYNEVLLKLTDGKVVALFVDNVSGYNPRLAIIPAGNYMTTDGTSCNFSVDTGGNVSW